MQLSVPLIAMALAFPQARTPAVEADPAAEVVRLTNVCRTRAGLPELREEPRLAAAARTHARDLARRRTLDHRDSEGRDAAERVERALYLTWTAVAENIAYGQRSAAEVVRAWMDSPGHRQNILDPGLQEIGVAVAKGADGRLYWVQEFGTRG